MGRMERKPIFPAFPQTRALPWVLVALALASLVYGIARGGTGFEVLGGTVLGAVIVAYPLAHVILGAPPAETPPDGPADDGKPANDS